MHATPYHNLTDSRVYRNVSGHPVSNATRWDFLRFVIDRLTSRNETVRIPPGHALSSEAAARLWAETPGDKLQWLGHSAFRWQLGSSILLSDPLLTPNASPFTWAGPRRFVPSPLQPEQARCDVLLLTHCHYDHLDLRTLRRLPA